MPTLSLRTRIAAVMFALVLLAQVIGYAVIQHSIHENALASAEEQLRVGMRVVQRLMNQNGARLAQSARSLLSDIGFQGAVNARDRKAMTRILADHSNRVGLPLAMFYDNDGAFQASSVPGEEGPLLKDVAGMINWMDRDGGVSGAMRIGDQLFHVFVMPVRGSDTLGWLLVGLPMDARTVGDMRELSQLHVSFLTQDAAAAWQSSVSTLSSASLASLGKQAASDGVKSGVFSEWVLDGEKYGTLVMPIQGVGKAPVLAVLQRSVDEAVAPFARLQVTLLVLTAVALLLSVVASIFMARRITQPVVELAESAKRLGAGNYDEALVANQTDEIGDLARAFNSMREDIAEREKKITRFAYWDTLTSLPNRTLFSQHLDQAIVTARAHEQRFAVLLMDLNRFKHVNDVLGHSFGDGLLREVATRIQNTINSKDDVLARLGGDEFSILLRGKDALEARTIADQLSAVLSVPITLDRQTVDLGAGIGIACFPKHAQNSEGLLACAEVAMYAAKRQRVPVLVYEPQLDDRSAHTLSLLSELRYAIERDELVLYWQPKVSLQTGKVVGAETLLRWNHPARGFLLPDRFIAFAEQTGFVTDITRWVMREAAAQVARWMRNDIRLIVSVNLSTRDLMDQDLPQRFADILARERVSASQFCLEVTESAIMDDPQRALQTVASLDNMGFKLSIDDFGTGYSSLAYLKRLPVDELKIDRSFVINMEDDRDDATIVRSTIDLGHNMGMRVVAEGMESEAIWHALRRAGCDQAQGFFLSKPLPTTSFEEWLSTWRSPPLSDGDPPISVVPVRSA